MSSSSRFRYLRSESWPIQWAKQNHSQQEAFCRLIELLHQHNELIGQSEKRDLAAGSEPYAYWLRDQKYSRLAFLHGTRGTGKSTLLSTLVQATTSAMSAESRRELEKVKPHIPMFLDAIRGKLVWLEPIDMEPHPENWHLLPAILVRIRHFAKRFYSRGRDSHGYAEAVQNIPDEIENKLLELDGLIHSIGQSWNGNLGQLASKLSASDFSSEIMRVEEDRLDLSLKINSVLGDLANALGISSFVIALDDFDMNPSACLEVLRMLRMISISRLFLIVLGDIEMVDVIVNLKYSNDLNAVYKDGMSFESASVRAEEIAGLSGAISSHGLRKLIPPMQRCRLTPLFIYEGMQFKPLGSHEVDGDLQELLRRIPCQFRHSVPCESLRKNPKASLLDFMLQEPFDVFGESSNTNTGDLRKLPRIEAFSDLDKRFVRYTGLHIAFGVARQAADLWLAFKEFVDRYESQVSREGHRTRGHEQEMARRLLQLIAERSHDSLLDEPRLGATERELVRSLFTRDDSASWNLAPLQIRISPLTSREMTTNVLDDSLRRFNEWPELVNQKDNRGLEAQVETGDVHSFSGSMSVQVTEFDGRAERIDLGLRTMGGLGLLHDLVYYSNDERKPLLVDWFQFDEIGSTFAQTVWRFGESQFAEYAWRLPPIETFFELDLFRSGWRAACDVVQQPRKGYSSSVEVLVYAWVAIGTAVITGHPPERTTANVRPQDWNQLFDLIETSLQSRSRSRRGYSSENRLEVWVQAMPIMFHPIFGVLSDSYPFALSFDEATSVSEFESRYPKMTAIWRRRSNTTQATLLQMLSKLVIARMTSVANELQRNVSSQLHRWGLYVSTENLARFSSWVSAGDSDTTDLSEGMSAERAERLAKELLESKSRRKGRRAKRARPIDDNFESESGKEKQSGNE